MFNLADSIQSLEIPPLGDHEKMLLSMVVFFAVL